MNKNIVYAFFGVLFLAVLVTSTTITDNGITTPQITGNSTFTGTFYNYTNSDAVIQLSGYNSLLESATTPSGGIKFYNTRPEAKAGVWWNGYDLATNSYRTVGWMVCHYNSSTGNGVHSHCSIETLDNSTGTPSINSHLAISYNGSQNLAEVTFPSSNVIFTADRGTYFDSSQKSLIQRITSSNKFEISDTNAVVIKGGARVDLYPEVSSTVGIRVTNDSSGTIMSVLGGTNFAISSTDMLQLKANTTSMSCSTSNAGNIYYDGSATKHYGCNGTAWNALY